MARFWRIERILTKLFASYMQKGCFIMSSVSSIRPLKVVAVSGSPSVPSRSEALIDVIIQQLQQHIRVEAEYVKLNQISHLLNGAAHRELFAPEIQAVLRQIEMADALIVASPVYRASYTSLFKYIFDYIEQYSLVRKPVLIAATGGSERHALVLDHQFHPLFSFFNAYTLPIGIYAMDKDFENYQLVSPLIRERIQLAVAHAIPPFLLAATFNLDAIVAEDHPVTQLQSVISAHAQKRQLTTNAG